MACLPLLLPLALLPHVTLGMPTAAAAPGAVAACYAGHAVQHQCRSRVVLKADQLTPQHGTPLLGRCNCSPAHDLLFPVDSQNRCRLDPRCTRLICLLASTPPPASWMRTTWGQTATPTASPSGGGGGGETLCRRACDVRGAGMGGNGGEEMVGMGGAGACGWWKKIVCKHNGQQVALNFVLCVVPCTREREHHQYLTMLCLPCLPQSCWSTAHALRPPCWPSCCWRPA